MRSSPKKLLILCCAAAAVIMAAPSDSHAFLWGGNCCGYGSTTFRPLFPRTAYRRAARFSLFRGVAYGGGCGYGCGSSCGYGCGSSCGYGCGYGCGSCYSSCYSSSQSCCSPCTTSSCYSVCYVPQTCYRRCVQRVPVTTCCRYTCCDPCSGCPVTVMRPVTRYVCRVSYSPYTTYRAVCRRVSCCRPCCPTSCCQPNCGTGCNGCNGCKGSSNVAPSLNGNGAAPQTFQDGAAPTPGNGAGYNSNFRGGPPLRLKQDDNLTTQAPQRKWSFRRAATATQLQRSKPSAGLAPVKRETKSIEDGGWRAARR